MTQYLKRKQKQSGFTLVELLVVIAIIGILTAIGIPMYNGYQASAKVSASKQNYDSMKSYIAGEITKCSSGLVANLPTMGTATITCPTDASDATKLQTYFVEYAKQTMKNPYDTTSAGLIAKNGDAPATGAVTDAGALYINTSATTSCTGLLISTEILDSGTSKYVSYPTSPQCISIQ